MSEREKLSLKPDEEYGYILEIDYIIPEDRHDKFSNYPLGPERKEVRGHMLSDYQKGEKLTFACDFGSFFNTNIYF